MMRVWYTVFVLMLMALTTNAQQNYDVSLIPKELLSHANAVIRNDETTVEVKDINNVVSHYKYAITILNKNADEKARIKVEHDKITHIRFIKGAIYNEYGKLTGKFSESDFDDRNVADGSLFEGDMIKHYRPAVTDYPYTIECEYETLSKQSLFLDDWNTGEAINTAVQHSSYTILSKPGFNIRYKESNFHGKVDRSISSQGFQTYKWSINELKSLHDEPYSPATDKLVTSVKIAPEKFSYDGISGSFTNWNEYGKWIYDKLLKDRRELPPETVQHIKDITYGIVDPKQKAKIIYEYMQQKTRYISVQIGIGGYQPFLASDVDQQSYGDCKALVNYTQSLLNAAGINSYYVLVMAGREDKASALPDFASMTQFDHVILCIPFKNDTIWLECTSQEIPFGYLGDFTDDRNVVACTPEGGILMHTPVYNNIDNRQTRKASFSLSGDGELSGEMVTRFEGTQYDDRDYLVKEARIEQIKRLKDIYPVENLDIQAFDLKQDKKNKPITTETINLRARDYVAKNGGRFFFTPNLANRSVTPLKNLTVRNNPVYINRGYLNQDEITYTLPDGYKVTTTDLNVNIDKPFGKYTASTKIVGNKLLYKRSLQLNEGTYSKDTYTDMVDFYQSVFEADNYQLTMEK